MFGADSFDERGKYATHATVLSNIVDSQGNSQMFRRVKPADAGPNSSIRLYLDILPTRVPVYARNADGSYTLDVDGNPVAVSGQTVAGFKAKWVATAVPFDNQGNDTFGIGAQIPGDQVDLTTSTQSIRYPFFDFKAPYFGADGNNYGIRMWAPTIKGTSPLDDRIVANDKVYPFRMSCVYRPTALSTPSTVVTQRAEQFVQVAFKPDTVDSNTETLLYVGDVFIQSYQDLDSQVTAATYGPFGEMHTYTSNIEAVLTLVYNQEKLHITEFSDIDGTNTDIYRLNLISGVSSQDVPYSTFVLNNTGNFVRLSENATIYASGGSDGTMNETLFAGLVTELCAEFAQETSVLQDSAKYPYSYIYDSGFPLATKYALLNFLGIRKDTFVFLSTHDVLGVSLSSAQENSMAIALRTRAQMYPDSEYYGTPVFRAMIVGRSGKLLNSQYTKRLPLTIEVAKKVSQYMGASNGVWKPGLAFDVAPQNQVSMFTDINVTFTPVSVRNKDWAAGLVWVQSYDRKSFFFPAFKTVYDNDTSVLNSLATAAVFVELTKVGERVWRDFTGRSDLTNSQFAERIDKAIVEKVTGRFDDRFVIVPQTYYTLADEARNYSFTTTVKVYANGMKTVMTFNLEARRREELETTP
jgi:hypothetical protein